MNSKLTPHEKDKERTKHLRGSALRKLSHHEYTHRLMRLLTLVHSLPLKDNFPRDEFIIRSAMISNILIADYHDKLTIEAGTLSYITQYCPYQSKAEQKYIHEQITDHFGKKRTDLVKEVEELRLAFLNEYNVEGFSKYAKDIYAIHIYLDLVNMLNLTDTKVLDGELIKVKIAKKELKIDKDHKLAIGDEYVTHEGDRMDLPRFYAYMVVVAEWKISEMACVHTQIKQALCELCKEIRTTKGVEIYCREFAD